MARAEEEPVFEERVVAIPQEEATPQEDIPPDAPIEASGAAPEAPPTGGTPGIQSWCLWRVFLLRLAGGCSDSGAYP